MIQAKQHLSFDGKEKAWHYQVALNQQTLFDAIRVNYVVKGAFRIRTTATLDQMLYYQRRLEGATQTKIAQEKAAEGLSRYAIGRYLKDRDRYYAEEVKAITAQNQEIQAYVDKRKAQRLSLTQIQVELGHAKRLYPI